MSTSLSIPIGGGFIVSSSPTDDLLSKGLSDAVACMFTPSIPIPWSNVRIESIAQDIQPVPAKWPEEIPIDDEGVFGPSRSGVASASQSSSASQSAQASAVVVPGPNGWSGGMFYEQAIARLGLKKATLSRMIERDEEFLKHYGNNLVELVKVKKVIKNELKEYDTAFKSATGRDPARSDKEPMRLLYTLYRKLREMISRIENNQPIVPAPTVAGGGQTKTELEQRLESLYEEKQSVRHVLQEYQARFMAEQGRRIKYHRDIVAVDREYRMYKQLKEEIAKLETQLGRQQTSHKNSNDFF
jgi:hypothetical protein